MPGRSWIRLRLNCNVLGSPSPISSAGVITLPMNMNVEDIQLMGLGHDTRYEYEYSGSRYLTSPSGLSSGSGWSRSPPELALALRDQQPKYALRYSVAGTRVCGAMVAQCQGAGSFRPAGFMMIHISTSSLVFDSL